MGIYALNGIQPELGENCWVAEDAVVVGQVSLGRNTSIWFGTVVRGDSDRILIGENTNVQDGCVLHTDEGITLSIGANVTVGHMAMLHGCTIGNGSLIGIGAVILNGAEIGENCIIGANTLIPEGKRIPARSLVMGSPGRIVRELSDEEVKKLLTSAAHYVRNAKRFATELQRIA